MRRVLFVCTANICRSPTAEHYMRHLLGRLGSEDRIEVRSAGILGIEGREADPVVVQLLRKRGIDMSGHRSRGVDAEEARGATSIVVMERRHKAWFREHLPDVLDRVTLIREHVDGPKDLADPIGESLDRYQECLGILLQAVENLTVTVSYPS
ncbi:MAG: low molecular weight protein arginine phosphatase [Acidobacteriota bacterium]